MGSIRDSIEDLFAEIAGKVSQATGSFWAFALAVITIVVWAVTGPLFGFSDTWQLVINTGTTIVTFLMVFVIQHAQNKDMRAVQLKLNELIAAVEGASNRLIDVEDLSDREVEHLYRRYQHLAGTAMRLQQGAHTSIEDEGEEAQKRKAGGPKKSRVEPKEEAVDGPTDKKKPAEKK